jgi:hypothetical protein
MESRHERMSRGLAMAMVLTVVASGAAAASADALNSPLIKPEGNHQWVQRGENVQLVAHEGAFSVKCPTMKGNAGTTGGSVFWFAQWELSNCTTNIGGTCTSPGLVAGHIGTSGTAEAHLFYLSHATHEAGVLFNWSVAGEQLTFTTFSCSGGLIGGTHTLTVRGSALAKVEPVNEATAEFKFALGARTGEAWVPLLTEYENLSGVKEAARLEVQEKVGNVEHAWQPAAVSFGKLWWTGERTTIEA